MPDEPITPQPPTVTIHDRKWLLTVEATYEDAHGSRRETFRLEVEPDITDDDIKALIAARY